jgi:hypothetical protein
MARVSAKAYIIKHPNAPALEIMKATGVSKATVYKQKWLLKKQIASGVDLSSLKVRRGRPRKNKLIDLSKAGSPLNTPDPKMPNFTPKHDLVNHPAHYTDGGIEVIDFIEAKRLGYHLGNVVKYICRAGKKGTNNGLEDLRKAQWYLKRAIERNEVYPSNK